MFRTLITCCLIAAFAFACSSGDEVAENSDSAAACATKPVNPNGDSELALLMRQMADWTDSCKAAITSGRPVPPKPVALANLHTAERTDKTIDASLFNSMASLYEGAVTTFESADSIAKVKAYDGMVAACGGCHQNFCQGPLTRISKMYIDAK